jgi:DNA-binding transcriptional MerR regulator
MLRAHAMTIGQLSQRTGVSIKVLRDYGDRGFLCTLGRSESNYRLFDERTLQCVSLVQDLRSLGLTLKEIAALLARIEEHPDEPIRPLLEASLMQVAARIETQIAALEALRHRILAFQTARTGTSARSVASTLEQLLARVPDGDAQYASANACDQ